jgi:glycosyltransferase involved in cell wall biosynthesis
MMGKQQATGIGNYIQQIVSRIVVHDTDNEYVLFVKPENKDLTKEYAHRKNVTVKVSRCHWYSLCEQIIFCIQLYTEKLDLVHFPQFNVPLAYRKPFVVTIHDITAFRFPGHKMTSRLRRYAFKRVFEHALRTSTSILTVSNYTKDEITRLYPKVSSKIEVTYLGVENEFFQKQKYDKIKEVQELFSITHPYLLYVGAWRNHKNLVGLLTAFDYLKSVYELDLQLVVGGQEDPTYQEPRMRIEGFDANTRDNIITPGFIDEDLMPALYQGAWGYVVPSFEEGFGLNGLEAMASGTPVIASQVASLPEIYQNAAIYFDPFSPEHLAEVIAGLMRNPGYQSDIVHRGHAHVQHFSWDKTALLTLECYTQALLAKHAKKEDINVIKNEEVNNNQENGI